MTKEESGAMIVNDFGCEHGHVGACTACSIADVLEQLRTRVAELETKNEKLAKHIDVARNHLLGCDHGSAQGCTCGDLAAWELEEGMKHNDT